MKVLLILLVCFIIFVIFIWIKVRKEIYHDPPNGTVYKYDDYDNEFSVKNLEK